MFRMCRRWAGFALLLLLLMGCGPALQVQQTAHPPVSTPQPSATPGNSNLSLDVPSLPTATPTPRPTATRAPTPTSGSNPPATSLSEQLEQQLFALINHDRSVQGLYPYVLNSTLSAGARLHSVKMSGCGLSHQCPGEPNPCQRVTNEGISWTSCGENVGYTSPYPSAWGGVQGIEKDMLDEQPPDDGHRLNLLSTSYHRIGVGIYIDARGYVWITEDFAS
jgi:uncharacterized protein YkwD